MSPNSNKWLELEKIISKMPLEVCCVIAIPEFGVPWKEVSRAVRNSRLPMLPSSVARVLRTLLAESVQEEDLDDILGRLRLKLVATQSRMWHVIHLSEPTAAALSVDSLSTFTRRMYAVLKTVKRGAMRPLVESIMLDDLFYVSIQFKSENKDGAVLYMAIPPGQPVALFSTIPAEKILRACTEALGYEAFEIASLYGKDKPSLLRIAAKNWTAEADHLTGVPAYEPMPTVTSNGIDYTYRPYDEQYIDTILGPNPPLLTEFNIKTTKRFIDPTKLNKMINLRVTLKSEDVAKSLRTWALKGAILPTSDFFQIFHQLKSNRIVIDNDED